jgi:hypothetical protein
MTHPLKFYSNFSIILNQVDKVKIVFCIKGIFVVVMLFAFDIISLSFAVEEKKVTLTAASAPFLPEAPTCKTWYNGVEYAGINN